MNRLNPIAIVLTVSLLLWCSLAAANSDQSNINAVKKTELLNALAVAKTEQEGKAAEDAIWQFWFGQSPTTAARTLLDAGIERREAYDFEAAEKHLDALVTLAPNYAEAYNQRAFIRFLRENYAEAETDLSIAIELEPDHFGALSGMYHILQRQNKREKALQVLQLAVQIHPWLQERSALPKTHWPKSYRNIHEPGQEI